MAGAAKRKSLRTIRFGRLEIGEDGAVIGERPLALSRTQLRVLSALASAKGKTVANAALLRQSWEHPGRAREAKAKLWAAIHRLRTHLGDTNLAIEVDRDVGYRLAWKPQRDALLLVEDDPSTQRAVERLLEGNALFIAASFAEAMSLFPKRRWAAIFLDIGLPDGDGLTFLEHIRKHDSDVPTMVISARTDELAVKQASRLHATYLAKPISPTALQTFARGAIKGG
jgi:DNA-binding response OmpR family regulator